MKLTEKDAKQVADAAAAKLKEEAAFLAQKAQETAEKTKEKAQEQTKQATNTIQEKILEQKHNLTDHLKKNTQFIKEKASEKANTLTGQAKEKIKESMTENARKLRDTSNAVVENLDPRVKGRRLRNRMLILAASGVFLYGFAANLPDAMAKYAIERVKIEEESKDSKKKTL